MKRLIFTIMLLAGAGYAQSQNHLHVGPDGIGVNRDNDCQSADNPCESIAYALNVARGGETINLLPGIHTEQIFIDKNITIRGADEKSPTILQAVADKEDARGRVVTIAEDGGHDVEISNLIIRHGRAIGNEPDNRGGGLYSKGNHIRLEKVEFSNNSAYTLGLDVERRHGGGGGVFIESGTGTFFDLIVIENEAEGNGGGFFLFQSEVTLDNVFIERNKAGVPNVGEPYSNPDFSVGYGNGGGLHLHKSDVTLHNAEIRGNGAIHGGGINSSDSQVLIQYSLLQDNSTDGGHGGGLAGFRGHNRLHNTRIIGNQANRGGGIFGGFSFTAVLVNCEIWDNHSTTGGGIFNENSGLIHIHSSTIIGNIADFRGGGVSNRFSGHIRIRNSIIWGNRAQSSSLPSHQIFNGDQSGGVNDSQLSMDYSLYSDFQGDIGGITSLEISNSIRNRNPLFMDAENGDFRLRFSSPARNAGDRDTDFSIYPGGNTTPIDLDGNPRVFDWEGGGIIDLGAYEIQGVPMSGPRYVAIGGDDMRGEGGNNCLYIGNPCGSISHAMEEALVGDDIIAGPGIFTEKLNIEKSTSISGAGSGLHPLEHTIIQAHEDKGVSDGRVVTIIDPGNTDDGWDIMISGLTIRNGKASGPSVNPSNRGGGIYNESSSLHLFDLLFTDNMANIGAGLYSSGTTTLSNVIFSGNEANQTGGGLLRQGGGGFANENEATLVNVVFSNNSAERVGGGLATGENSNTTLTNVTFSSNSAENGGGIFNADDAETTVQNTILWGNTAADSGNEIQNSASGVLFINYSLYRHRFGMGDIIFGGSGFTFDNILTADPLFVNADSENYRLQQESPAINAGNPEIDGLLYPTGIDGTRIDIAGNNRFSDGVIDIGAYEFQGDDESQSTDNYYVSPEGNNAEGANTCQYSDNPCATIAHAIVMAPANAIINLSAGEYTEPGLVIDKVLEIRGNAQSDTFIQGHPDGPELATNRVLHINQAGNVVLRDFTVRHGRVTGSNDGGGIYVNNTPVELTNITISHNIAGRNGAGIYLTASEATENPANFTNVTIRENTGATSGGGNGGGIHVNSVVAELTNTDIEYNSANTGGGLYMAGSASTEVYLLNSKINNNESMGEGGGVRMGSSIVSLRMEDSEVNGNKAGVASGGKAGGLEIFGNVHLENVTVSNNSVTGTGGGISFITTSTPRVMTLKNVTISGNSSTGDGGGMFIMNNIADLSNVQITGNQSGNQGGGVHLSFGNTEFYMVNSIVSNNEADLDSGGLHFSGGANTPDYSLVNSVISNNTANRNGGGITIGAGTSLTNVTVSGNQAENVGGGLWIFSNQDVNITNSILWGNVAESENDPGHEMYHQHTATTLSYSIFKNEDGDIIDTSGNLSIDNPVNLHPRFIDPPDDLSVNENSSAINAGDPDTDLSLFPVDESDNPLDLAGKVNC